MDKTCPNSDQAVGRTIPCRESPRNWPFALKEGPCDRAGSNWIPMKTSRRPVFSEAGPTGCRWYRPALDGLWRCSRVPGARRMISWLLFPRIRSPVPLKKSPSIAVMAGCKPEYMPVVLAALEAACADTFCLHGLLATTYFSGPVVIVNGPITKAIGMNSGINALGQGNRANATIGRGAATDHPQYGRRPALRRRPGCFGQSW